MKRYLHVITALIFVFFCVSACSSHRKGGGNGPDGGGPAGKEASTGSSSQNLPVSSNTGQCGAQFSICKTVNDCCAGLTCPKISGVVSQCAKPCKVDSDCESGNCGQYEGYWLCGPGSGDSAVAQCGTLAEACGADVGVNCCSPYLCVTSQNPAFAGCRSPCQANTDCDTNCCQKFTDSTDGFCVAGSYCECPKEGAACGADAGVYCCNAQVCVTSDNPDFAGCRAPCSANADCDTDCCQKFTNRNDGFCVAGSYCECVKQGAACGSYQRCCEGLSCASLVSANQYFCLPSCTNSQQCADGGYCVLFTGQDAGVCAN